MGAGAGAGERMILEVCERRWERLGKIINFLMICIYLNVTKKMLEDG